jgi:outer membrane protein assembly factor BamB
VAGSVSSVALAAPSGWRGDGSGRFPEAKPPLHWSATQNVVWSVPTPATGNATPAIQPDRLFITAEPTTLLCLSTADGHLLWRRDVSYLDTVPAAELPTAKKEAAEAEALGKELAEATKEADKLRREARKKSVTPEAKARLEALTRTLAETKTRFAASARFRPPEDIPTVGNASSSPVTDGQHVYVSFGNHVVASFTRDGALRWARYLPPEKEQSMHGYTSGRAASLLLSGKTLVVPLNKLRGLDVDTGRTRWTSEDYLDYGTPALARAGGTDVVLTPDGNAVRVSDGKKVKKGLPFILYVGPTVGEGVLLYAGNVDPAPPNKAEAEAFAIPGAAEPFEPKRLWTAPLPFQRQYATPLIAGGHVFAVDETGELSVLDAKSGKKVGGRKLEGGTAFPSPTFAGGYVYVGGADGTTWVLESKPPFREVAKNTLPAYRASPVFVGKRLYQRTLERMYCIEEP